MKIGSYCNFFPLYIRMSETTTYYERNRETMLSRAKDHYKNNKKLLREKGRNKCRNYLMKKKI